MMMQATHASAGGSGANTPVPDRPRPSLRVVDVVSDAVREVVVSAQWQAADGVKAIELRAADGGTLPDAEPGAHVDVHLPDGTVRQYSLTRAGTGPSSYRIGVLNDPQSRGGSRYLVEQLRNGEHLHITGPRNHFALDADADNCHLIAGGIGITPLLAMVRQLVEQGHRPVLHYLVRQRARAAFLDELETLLPAGHLHLHVDDEHGRADLSALLGAAREQGHVYACGPEPLLRAITELTGDWARGRVHMERFSRAAEEDSAVPAADAPCRVQLKRSGIEFELQPDETLLEALERQDLDPPCLCREGVCGTCAVGIVEGEVDHRDSLQDDEEKAENEVMYVCVSRPTGARLVLDM